MKGSLGKAEGIVAGAHTLALIIWSIVAIGQLNDEMKAFQLTRPAPPDALNTSRTKPRPSMCPSFQPTTLDPLLFRRRIHGGSLLPNAEADEAAQEKSAQRACHHQHCDDGRLQNQFKDTGEAWSFDQYKDHDPAAVEQPGYRSSNSESFFHAGVQIGLTDIRLIWVF